jgi:LysR family glycine cleavage system transcriptional activator
MTGKRLPPLKALRVFEVAARSGSFTAAAEELHLTPGAVSQQIRILEDFIGKPLFSREARGVTLTPAARRYHEAIHGSLEAIAAATAQLRAAETGEGLVIATSPSLAMHWLIPRIAQLSAALADTDIRVSTASRHGGDPEARLHNVIIETRPVALPGFTAVRFKDDFCIPVAAPDFRVSRPIRQPIDCLGYPLLHTTDGRSDWADWLRLTGQAIPEQLPGPIFDHPFLCMQATINRMGIAVLPWSVVEGDVQAGRLIVLFDAPRLERPGLYAFIKDDQVPPELARGLLRCLAS